VEVRYVPHGVGLHDVTLKRQVTVQGFIRGLIVANRHRAVRRVLETLLDAGVARERKAQHIVHAKRESILEPSIERRLD
jgi:hypothetical protein